MLVLRARLIAVAALGLGVLVLAAQPASSLDPPFKLKVAKSENGPYRRDISINLGEGERKRVYYRAKSTSDETAQLDLLGDTSRNGYRLRWFKGDQEITQDVGISGGYQFNLPSGATRKFEATIKRSDESSTLVCLEALLQDDKLVMESYAYVGVNGQCIT